MPASKLPSCAEPSGSAAVLSADGDGSGCAGGVLLELLGACGGVIRLSTFVVLVLSAPALFFLSGILASPPLAGQTISVYIRRGALTQAVHLDYSNGASLKNRAVSSGGVGLI